MLKSARANSLAREISSGFSFYLVFSRLSSRCEERRRGEGGDEMNGVENNLDVPFETRVVP